jgi:hypothetical protein
MTQLPESGSIALSHPKIRERARGAMSSQTQCTSSRLVPRNDHWMPGAADLLHPRVTPAELAQARLFEAILQAEFARLTEVANRVARPLGWLNHRDTGSGQPSPEVMQTHARTDEIRRLLEALRDRFPHALWDGERQANEWGAAPS